jgi:hypothetical protein
MKTRLALLACSFALTSPFAVAFAQEAAWDIGYDYLPRPGFHPLTMKGTPDGGFVMAGIARDLPLNSISSPSEVVIAKFTENGDRTWVTTRPLPTSYHGDFVDDLVGVDVAPDGNVYVVEPRQFVSRLIRYLPDGTIAWQRTVGFGTAASFQVLVTHVDASSPGEVVVAGTHMEGLFFPYVQLQTYTDQGALGFSVPSLVAPVSPQLLLRKVRRGPSGEIFLFGLGDTVGDDATLSTVETYDPSGVRLWSRTVGTVAFPRATEVSDVASTPDGMTTIVASETNADTATRLLLVRVDSAGNQVFERSYTPGLGIQVDAQAMALLPGGGFAVAGSVERTLPGNERAFALMIFDSDGQEVAVSFLPNASPEDEGSADQIVLDAEGNLVVLGWSEGAADEGVLASFDVQGNPRWVRRIRGSRPVPTLTNSTSTALDFDTRGNVFSLIQGVVSGVEPNQDLSLRMGKTMRGGEVSAEFCGPGVPNSTGLPGTLRIVGLDGAMHNNLSLVANDLPGGAFTLFLDSETAANVPGAGGGQGTLCLGGSIGRFAGPGQIRRATQQGGAWLQLDLTALPQPTSNVQAMAGQTWRFQAWHRDANPGVTSNFTNGVSVVLQ